MAKLLMGGREGTIGEAKGGSRWQRTRTCKAGSASEKSNKPVSVSGADGGKTEGVAVSKRVVETGCVGRWALKEW